MATRNYLKLFVAADPCQYKIILMVFVHFKLFWIFAKLRVENERYK